MFEDITEEKKFDGLIEYIGTDKKFVISRVYGEPLLQPMPAVTSINSGSIAQNDLSHKSQIAEEEKFLTYFFQTDLYD